MKHWTLAVRRGTSSDAIPRVEKNLIGTDTVTVSVACAFMVCAVLMLSACGGADAPAKGAAVKQVAPALAVPASSASAPDPASSPSLADSAASAPSAASTPAPASAPAAQVPASTPVVKIEVYGDDQMAGFALNQYGFPSVVSPNEPAALQSLLQQRFNDTGITVTNRATGGTSSSLYNELRGMDGNGDPFADRIKLSAASIVIESHTINDALGGETVADYRQYLADWVVAVRAAGKTPVLEESGPVCDSDHPQLAAYGQAMDDAAVAYDVPIIKQYSYIQGIAGWQSHMTGCLYPDATLLAAKAQQELGVIAPLVKSALGE
jgi:hypothetical protein